MSWWFSFLNSANSLISLAGALILALAWWKLHLFVGNPVTLTGMLASLISLGTWLIYGMLWVVMMMPMSTGVAIDWIWQIPFLWDSLWVLTTVAGASSLLCLAWTLHRGIRPRQTPV